MLPENLVPARVDRGVVVPLFLTAADHSWLGILMEEIDRFRGRPRRELRQRLRAPLPCAAPYIKSRAATGVLLGMWKTGVVSAVEPGAAREAAFMAAAASAAGRSRQETVSQVASGFGVTVGELEAALFADLPDERLVRAPAEIPSVPDAALRVNLAIARSLLFRASVVRIRAEGGIRPVVRQARLRGLLCSVRVAAARGLPEMEISGPFALFRRTVIYGRALGELLPFLARTARFELQARCFVDGQEGELRLQSSDPIFPAAEPRVFDSKVEERFARDFTRLAPDWDLLREPEPVPAGSALVFPDFLIRHRLDHQRQFLLEIVGFWTPDYVERKLAGLRAARIANLILVIDEERRCAEGDVPAGARVVWYRRRIDVQRVVDLLV